MLDVLQVRAPRPSGRKHHISRHLAGLATRRGEKCGLATDGPVSNNTLDILESLRLMALVAKHESGDPRLLPVGEALTIATRDSARVYGLPDDLGHLAPGFLADIVLVDLGGPHNLPPHDPAANLVYSARASDVRTVICDGKVLMRNRQLLTLDVDEITAKVGESMSRLSQRVPDSRNQLYRP